MSYGDWDNPENISLECVDCGEVILDGELYTLAARTDVEDAETKRKTVNIIATDPGIENHGLSDRTVTFTVEVDAHLAPEDILKHIKTAATEYCQTEDGRRTYIGNCNCFNIGDAFTYIPKKFFNRYGIFPQTGAGIYMHADFNDQLVDENDIIGMDS